MLDRIDRMYRIASKCELRFRGDCQISKDRKGTHEGAKNRLGRMWRAIGDKNKLASFWTLTGLHISPDERFIGASRYAGFPKRYKCIYE
jgi:hypothetical protein